MYIILPCQQHRRFLLLFPFPLFLLTAFHPCSYPLYAKAAVIIAIEYTSEALQPRDKSFTGAFNPSITGP